MTFGRACLVGAGVVAAAALVAGQQPVFRAGVAAVRVDVLVTSDGRPVTGLGRDDFELRDNGVVQHVDLVDPVELPLNLVLVFDLSESVAGTPLTHLKAASRAVLEGLRTGDRVALVGFAESVQLGCPLTADYERVSRTLDEVLPAGQTSWQDAAFAGLMLAETEPGRSLALVFTDGVDTTSWMPPDALTDIARRTGVVTYGASAGAARKPADLERLAAATGGRLIAVDSASALRGTFIQILDEFRRRYVLAFSPQAPSPGWHRLDVRLKSKRGSVTARPGYWVEGRPPALTAGR
jgi:Ca-activated chloride channel homolog